MSTAPRHFWREEAQALANGASSVVFLPRRIDGLTAVAIPGGGGSAYVEYTLSAPSLVQDDPSSAVWLIWEAGSVVSATARALMGPVVGLRLQAVGQPGTLQVSAWTDF